jgi:hypothetical protein
VLRRRRRLEGLVPTAATSAALVVGAAHHPVMQRVLQSMAMAAELLGGAAAVGKLVAEAQRLWPRRRDYLYGGSAISAS